MKKYIDSVASQTPQAAPGEEGPEQLSMFERKSGQKKKYKDAVVSREIQKARAAYPSAGSDVEALVKREIETDNKQDLAIANLDDENKKLAQQISAIAPTATPAPSVAPTPAVSRIPSVPSAVSATPAVPSIPA